MSDKKFPISSLNKDVLSTSLSFLNPRDRLSLGESSKGLKHDVEESDVWKSDAKRFFRASIKKCPTAREQYLSMLKEAVLQFKARYMESHSKLAEEHPIYDRFDEPLRAIEGNRWLLIEYLGARGYTIYDMALMGNEEISERYHEAKELKAKVQKDPILRSFFVDAISIDYPYFGILYERALKRAVSEGYDITKKGNKVTHERFRFIQPSPGFGRILFEAGLGERVADGVNVADFQYVITDIFSGGVLARRI